MLTDREKQHVYRHAYLPEHLVDYVCAINNARPHLIENHLCFTRNRHLFFVGYPLNRSLATDVHNSFQKAISTFHPATATLYAATLGHPEAAISIEAADNYYFLPLPPPATPAALAYMVRRARKETHLSTVPFGAAHQELIHQFLATNTLSRQQRLIYQRIGNYCRSTPTVQLLQATSKGQLVAFSVVDFGSAQHAFYQFHIRDVTRHVPGCSDLLFDQMLYLAQRQGKTGINLGLGTLCGIRRFKKKWGGRPYFKHHAVQMRFKATMVEKLLGSLDQSTPYRWN